MWISKGLGSPASQTADCSLHDLSLGLALLIAYGFPWQLFHITGISNLPGSQRHLCSFSFTHCPLWGSFPDLPGFYLRSAWKPPWPHNSWSLHACTTNTMWIPCGWCQDLVLTQEVVGPSWKWPECLDSWIWGNTFIGSPEREGQPGALLSKQSFKGLYPFTPLNWWWIGVWLFVEMPLRHLFLLSCTCLLFNTDLILLTLIGPDFTPFWPNCKFCK